MLLEGEARYRPVGHHAWKTIRVGSLIGPGAIVQTTKSQFSTVYLYLGEKTVTPKTPFGHGGLYNPTLHPANLLGLYDDTIIQLREITNELSDEKILKQKIQLTLYGGTIRGNVKTNTTLRIDLTNGVFVMQTGTFNMNSSGNVDLFEGSGELRLFDRGTTNFLTSNESFDAKTGKITELDITKVPTWRHDIWLPSDPAYIDWVKPPTITPIDRELSYKKPPSRPF